MTTSVTFVNYSAPHFGIRWGLAGEIEIKEMTCKKLNKGDGRRHTTTGSCMVGHKDHPYGGTSYFTLKLGPLSLGTQATFKDPMDPTTAGIKNKRSIVAGAALMFGDTLSISYGESWDKYRYNDACRGGDSNESIMGAGTETYRCGGANIYGMAGISYLKKNRPKNLGRFL